MPFFGEWLQELRPGVCALSQGVRSVDAARRCVYAHVHVHARVSPSFWVHMETRDFTMMFLTLAQYPGSPSFTLDFVITSLGREKPGPHYPWCTCPITQPCIRGTWFQNG